MELQETDINVLREKKELQILNFFWAGFILYTAAFTISTSSMVNYTICNILQIIGLFVLIPSAMLLFRLRFDNDYLKIVFLIYCVWQIAVIVRGFIFSYEYVKQLIFNAYDGMFIYLAPLILLFPKNLNYIKKVIWVIVILGVIYLVFDLIFIRALTVSYDDKNSQNIVEYFSKTLSIPCGFILLSYMYHSKKINLFALFILALTFILAIIRARRALALLALAPLVFSYLIYFFHSKNWVLKIVFFMLMTLFIVIGIAYLQTIYNFFQNSKVTNWFIDRIAQDTRSGVEEYFFRDMKGVDWIVGRGLSGKYFCPGVMEGPGRISIYRTGIETDYLNIILKGGIISLGLKLLIMIPAIIKGLFSSRNMLSKAAALWILMYLSYLYPAPVTTFSLNYLLVWISVGICYSREIREMPESRVKEFFSGHKNIRRLNE